MPQLVKRGKYVFGWTMINDNYKVRIPDEAYEEYGLTRSDKAILISGSKSSGGLSVNSPDSIYYSKFSNQVLTAVGYNRASGKFSIDRLEIVKLGERLISWTILDKEKYFHLSEIFIGKLDIKKGDRLLVIRGSGIGPSFIRKGIIFNEALKHKDILEFC